MIGVTIKKKESLNTLCKAKRKYSNNLNIKILSFNKIFWKTINLFFLDKGLKSKTIMHNKKKIVYADKERSNTMKNYFMEITKHSNLRNRTKSISRKYHRHFLKSWKYSED